MNEPNSQIRNCILKNEGIVDYYNAWEKQKYLVTERIANSDLPDCLILLEHPEVYTLGTGASTEFLHFDPQKSDRQVYRIERGGEVTYHCLGQLVGYPILNLKYYRQDLHWYLRQLEEVIIRVLKLYDLTGYRIPGMTGVWLEDKKIAAIGIKVRRWVTMHGFALNVCPDLSGFNLITPCGIKNKFVGSLAEFRPQITVDRVKVDVAKVFTDVFGVQFVENNVDSVEKNKVPIPSKNKLN